MLCTSRVSYIIMQMHYYVFLMQCDSNICSNSDVLVVASTSLMHVYSPHDI